MSHEDKQLRAVVRSPTAVGPVAGGQHPFVAGLRRKLQDSPTTDETAQRLAQVIRAMLKKDGDGG